MKTNFLKSLVAMLAIATSFAFVACTDNEEDGGKDGNPSIEVSKSALSFTSAEDAEQVSITSNADWRAEMNSSADWVTVNPAQGNGNKTVTISVAENTTGKAREAEVKFIALHPTYGAWDTKKVTVTQSATEEEVVPVGDAIYKDGFDNGDGSKANDKWPSVADRANPQGTAAANVTYKVEGNVSVRNSGKASDNTDYSNYKGSGVNKVFFGTSSPKLTVQNIALPATETNYVLTFGANRYDGTEGADNTFKNEELIVSVSDNGEGWTPIEYSFPEGVDLNGKWNLATASLKLPVVPEKFYIKFEATIASIISIDDIALATGGAGEQVIEFKEPVPVEDVEGTVTEVLAAAQGAGVKAIDATVVAVSSRAYLLTDGTSYILAYMAEGTPAVVVGDKVTVEGKMGSYGTPAVPQIVNPVATKTGTVENFAQPEATVIDGAALDAYKDNFAIKYVKVADANLVKSGTYWNFTLEGASTATGSLANPTAEMCPESNHGKKVTIHGYVIYLSGASSQYVNVIATSVEVTGEGEAPSEPTDELGDDERYLSDEGLMITEDGDVKAYAHFVTIENGKYPALKLGTSSVVGSWTTEAVGVEGDYTLSFYAFGWNGKSSEVTVAVDGNVVETIAPASNAGINGTGPNYAISVDQERDFYTVELTGLTAESTITFATTNNKCRVVLCGIKLAAPGEDDEPIEPVAMEPTAVAEGYQGVKVSWEAVEGAEAYAVYYTVNGEDQIVEVGKDAVEAVIAGLTDARKYNFEVEAYDANDDVVGAGVISDVEVYTLFDYAPEFEIVKQDDGSWKLNMYKLAYEGGIFRSIAFTLKEKGSDEVLYSENGTEGETGFIADGSHFGWANKFYTPWRKQTDSAWSTAEGKKLAGVEFKHNTTYVVEYTAALTPGMVALTLEEYAGPDDYFNIANYEAGTHVYYKSLLRRDDNIPTTTGTMEFTTEEAPAELTATAAAEGYQGAKVTWNAIEGATAYEVYVGETKVADAAADATSAVVTGLTDATKYTFVVKAVGTELTATTQEIEIYSMTGVDAPEFELIDNEDGTYNVKVAKNAATLRAFFVNFHINYKDSEGNYLFDEPKRASGGYLDSSLPVWLGYKVTGYDNFCEGDGVMKNLTLAAGETYTVEYTATYAFITGATVHSDGSRKLFGDNILKAEGGLHGLYTLDVPGTATITTPEAEPTIEKITIAEFLEKADTETVYELTGQVSNIERRANYSNFYIKDNTGELYIYGFEGETSSGTSVLDAKGIEIPDEITLQGVYSYYAAKDLKQINKATYVSHTAYTGAWISSATPSVVAFSWEGGSEDVAVSIRNGEGVTPTLSSLSHRFDATWDAENSVVKITADVNTEEIGFDETLTISVEGGNSIDIQIHISEYVEPGSTTTYNDELVATMFKATNTTYTAFSGVAGTNGAVYAGKSAKSAAGAIQLRSSKSEDGIVTTASGGKVRKVVVEWHSDTSATGNRTLDVYGSNTAFTGATQLYNVSGDTIKKLGSITCGSATELIIVGDYDYVGFRSKDGAMYINKITVTYEK